MRQQIEVAANTTGLAQLMSFSDMAERALPLLDEQCFVMRLTIEEIATNIIKYGYSGDPAGPIQVECWCEHGELHVVIRDRGTPFDPHSAPAPDLVADLAQRKIGGLGLFLVRELADELIYRHAPATGWNELSVLKRGEASSV